MAFIQYSDIAISLPDGHDQTLAERLLDNTEFDLIYNYNMEFVADSALNTDLVASSIYQTMFYFWFIKTITSLKVKHSEYLFEYTLVADVDYRLIEVPNMPGVYYAIELIGRYRQGIKDRYYLELIGTKGYAENVPTRIKNAIIDFLYRQLSIFNIDSTRADRLITQSDTGESSVTFSGKGISNSTFDSAVNDNQFKSVIFKFLPPV